jgi:hypothetical protein
MVTFGQGMGCFSSDLRRALLIGRKRRNNAEKFKSHLRVHICGLFWIDWWSSGGLEMRLKSPGPQKQLRRYSVAVVRVTISPGSHSATTSNGRQQTSQSVVNRWLATLVSIVTVDVWPQNGHWMSANSSTRQI